MYSYTSVGVSTDGGTAVDEDAAAEKMNFSHGLLTCLHEWLTSRLEC
jgi:hypothetical protein